jgi:hypothetical protein
VVLSIDRTAKFFHYGPQGCRSGWVKGDGWETPITFNEGRAWQDAQMQLQAAKADAGVLRLAALAQDDGQKGEEPVVLTPGGMYPKEVDAEGHTLHSKHCKAAFARRDWQCHRCCELMHGAAPRDGWQKPFFARKLREVQKYFLWPNDVA